MAELTAARAALADALTGTGRRVLDHEPERITPPVALVAPADPYLSTPDPPTFGAWEARWRVRLVVAVGTAETVTDAIEDFITDALVSLVNAGHTVAEVTGPYTLLANGVSYAAADLTVTRTIRP